MDCSPEREKLGLVGNGVYLCLRRHVSTGILVLLQSGLLGFCLQCQDEGQKAVVVTAETGMCQRVRSIFFFSSVRRPCWGLVLVKTHTANERAVNA